MTANTKVSALDHAMHNASPSGGRRSQVAMTAASQFQQPCTRHRIYVLPTRGRAPPAGERENQLIRQGDSVVSRTDR